MKNTPLRVMLLAPGHSIHSQRFLGWLQNAGLQILFVDAVRPPNINPQTTRFVPYHNTRPMLTWLRRAYLWSLARTFEPNLVHVHQINWRAQDCAAVGLQPLCLTAWGSDINQHFAAPPSAPNSTLVRRALQNAAHLFADSPQILARAQALAGQPIHTSLMFFGIDTQRFQPTAPPQAAAWRAQLGIAPNTRLLLSIRGWKSLYRHEEILRAFAAVLPRLPFPAALLFKPYPPGNTAYETNLRALADTLGIQAHIHFLPPIADDDMPALYHLADAIVNYPQEDGFPVSFLEAAASGCPIVTIDLPAYHAAGLQNQLVLVPPNNLAALSEAMLTTLKTSHPRQNSALRAWAQTHANEGSALETLLNVYYNLQKP